jgi:hypothetical protein
MSSFISLFRSFFAPEPYAANPSDAFSTTLHDALRLNGESLANEGQPRFTAGQQSDRLTVIAYDGLPDLRRRLRSLDQDDVRLNVILALKARSRGDLASLLERETLANRLVIVRAAAHSLGLLSAADLVLLAPRLGWLRIEFGDDLAEEIRRSLAWLDDQERLVVLRPGQRHERRPL